MSAFWCLAVRWDSWCLLSGCERWLFIGDILWVGVLYLAIFLQLFPILYQVQVDILSRASLKEKLILICISSLPCEGWDKISNFVSTYVSK